jgi:[NiFe] hydrogenase diaphorase moiety large subunit
MDVVHTLQNEIPILSDGVVQIISQQLKIAPVKIRALLSFYSFFLKQKKGKIIIRLCNDVVDIMAGYENIARAFKTALKIDFNQTTADNLFTLEHTPCIGMCDQAPAALINNVVFPRLSPEKIRVIIQKLKKDKDPQKIVCSVGDGNNASALINSAVNNNIRQKGEVIFSSDYKFCEGLKRALSLNPEEVLNEIKISRLRGRGGAGFPTAMKWEFTRASQDNNKTIICNADEGEPGTFKDRVLLTENADMLFEGMIIAGYAIGAQTGIIYLRGEYAYLQKFLEHKLAVLRKNKILGADILGKSGFNFDLRIQLGAGAYICGEETALISSCEGRRGDPKNRPPFPAQKGYLQTPTAVNNVETFCCVSRILEKGAPWFVAIGTKDSSGTKLLSISGDCKKPGVYEIPFGIKVIDLLKKVGASQVKAILIGGPSGQFIGRDKFNRRICYNDLATGGAVVILGKQRNILKIVNHYMEFFIDENCGYCTPCRVGNVLLKQCLENIINGKGMPGDLDYLKKLGQTIKITSRCGLGQTSANPILSSLENFPQEYKKLVKPNKKNFNSSFDIKTALADGENISNRDSEIFVGKK